MGKGADGYIQVARCMAEANLVNGDLVEILADWKEEDTENKAKHRLALACGKPIPHNSLRHSRAGPLVCTKHINDSQSRSSSRSHGHLRSRSRR